jgi:hypothetical protein
MKRIYSLGKGLTVLVMLPLLGCNEIASTPAPPRVDEAVKFPEAASSLVIPISLDLSALKTQLESAIPHRLVTISENREDCTPDQYLKTCLVPKFKVRGFKVSKDGCSKWVEAKIADGIDCHIDAHADRGDISIAAQGNVITVSLPVTASATVRGRGELINKLRETVSGSINATATITADIDEQWNPVVSVTPDFSWRERANLRVLGFEITVGSKVEPEIRKAMAKLQSQIDVALAKFALRRRAEQLWASAPTLTKVGSNPDVWLRFIPQQVGFSGLSSTPHTLDMTLMASGITQAFVGPRPSDVPLGPLPALVKTLPEAGFQLYLPVFADYGSIEAALASLLKLDQPQQIEVPNVGTAEVTFKKVSVYPTHNGALAIGLALEADPPHQLFDTKGTVWLKARLGIDAERLRLVPSELDYGAQSDNAATNLLVAIARLPMFRSKVEGALAHDFTEHYQQALKEANAALNRDVGSGFVIEGAIVNANADDIRATPNGLYLGMFVSGSLRLVMSSPAESAT